MTEITDDDEIPDPGHVVERTDPDMWLRKLMMLIMKTPEPRHMFEIPDEEKYRSPGKYCR